MSDMYSCIVNFREISCSIRTGCKFVLLFYSVLSLPWIDHSGLRYVHPVIVSSGNGSNGKGVR
jgi:hypothetical protein